MDMTTGQKIGECRKHLGLSQEALGEKMGVSRQAISKWESDSTLPEIEKLIGLSRLFEVNVGWLLGVEELHSPQTQQVEVSEELLRKIEETVLRYRPQEKKPGIGKRIVTGIAISAILLSGIHLYSQWQITRNEVGYLSGQVRNNNEQNARILAQLDGLNSQISAKSETTISLTCYTFDVEPHETENAIMLHFHAIPDQWHKEYKAFLVVEFDKKEYVKQQCVWSSSGLRSALKLEVQDSYSYYLLAEFPDGSIIQIPLEDETAENPKTAFTVGITMHSGSVKFNMVEKIATLQDYDITLHFPESLVRSDLPVVLASSSHILYGCTQENYWKAWTELGTRTLYHDVDTLKEMNWEITEWSLNSPFIFPDIAFGHVDTSNMVYFRLALRIELSNGMTTEYTLNEWERTNRGITEMFSLQENETE